MERWCPDALWELAAPLIPPALVRPQGGDRRRVDDRAVLAAICYLTQAGCLWWKLPEAMFGVTRATAHRRFTEWTKAGLWPAPHLAMLQRLQAAWELDWSRAVIDSIQVRAEKGGDLTGPSPVDRGKPGSKIHAMSERGGLPLVTAVSAANTPDAAMLLPLLDGMPAVSGRRGRPRRRPDKLHADKAYDHRSLRAQIRRRGITLRIARKKVESSQRLGRHRWVIERTMSWLMRYRRLVRRYDRYATHFAAFVSIACALVCYRKLAKQPK
ncbi:IS5 family transposase [Micromonospora thermarum]|uniref:IS5 family transposase n=1 Tax=Micromonospora thermarum TaxID=2720024 RepID=A0ABX0ZEL3_9ACTN|nr:IS5 family transposase [Micromonospora thermarum]NJP35493.1 IS5 family transposase [Micromonospora thermarum]